MTEREDCKRYCIKFDRIYSQPDREGWRCYLWGGGNLGGGACCHAVPGGACACTGDGGDGGRAYDPGDFLGWFI